MWKTYIHIGSKNRQKRKLKRSLLHHKSVRSKRQPDTLNGSPSRRSWQKRVKRHQLRSHREIRLRYDYFNLLFKHPIHHSFIIALTSFELAVEANVSCIHVTAASKCLNIIVLHCGDDIVVALEPVFTSSMNPSNVVTSIG